MQIKLMMMTMPSPAVTTAEAMIKKINEFDSSNHSMGFSTCSSFSNSFYGGKVYQLRRRRQVVLTNGLGYHNYEAANYFGSSGEETCCGKKRRVVVTGLGLVTPLGHHPNMFYNNLLDGVSGISFIQNFDCSSLPTKIGGEIKSVSTDGWVSPKLVRKADKFMLYAFVAAKKALADGAITLETYRNKEKRFGILIGTALGGRQLIHDALEALEVSPKKILPFALPFAISNMGAAMLAVDLGWMGPNYSPSSACATSNTCILNAADHIRRGQVDMMLAGGSDGAVIPSVMGGFSACRLLSQKNNDPTKASRPWDIDRDGVVIGEGAGVLVLEELQHAERRGAKIYAELLGGSFTCDAYHVTNPLPDGKGMRFCMEKALAQTGVRREDVNYINAHAASTQIGDLSEYKAVVSCFKQNSELKMNSTKSMIGHLLGASGAVEAIATIKAIETGWIHPNINLDNPEKAMDMNKMAGSKKERLDVQVAMSNSFGLGGQNSSILFAHFKN